MVGINHDAVEVFGVHALAVVNRVIESRYAPSSFALCDENVGDMPTFAVFVDHGLAAFEVIKLGGSYDHDYTVVVAVSYTHLTLPTNREV